MTDGDSVTINHLCDSANGTFVTLDDYLPHTIYTEGGTRVSEGETSAGCGAVARSPDGRLYVMFGPVITTEAHLAY